MDEKCDSAKEERADMATKKKSDDGYRYVVYTQKVGRTEKGIVHALTRVVGDTAYVIRGRDENRADILPKENVFTTLDAAEKYLAGDGAVRWVVGTTKDGDFEVPTMFEGKVVFYPYIGRRYPERRAAIFSLTTGKAVQLYRDYGTQYFEDQSKAEAYYAERWTRTNNELLKYFNQYKTHLAMMAEIKPGARKKKKAAKG